jgi:hypothetical protein
MIGRTTTKTTIFNKNYKGNVYIRDQIIPVVAEDKPLLEQIPIGVVIDLTTDEKILEEQQLVFNGLIEIGALEEVAPYGYTASGKIRTKPLKSQVIVNGME